MALKNANEEQAKPAEAKPTPQIVQSTEGDKQNHLKWWIVAMAVVNAVPQICRAVEAVVDMGNHFINTPLR